MEDNFLLNEMIAADCVLAEKDADLMNVFKAGIQQKKEAPEENFRFTETMDRLFRVIFPGRLVDYMASKIQNTSDLSDLPKLQRSVMENLSPAECDLIFDVGRKIIALHLRDHPGEESDSLRSSYQMMTILSKNSNHTCIIL